jgi:acyl-coenzyme A thioesterase PaaI-like protein
MAAGRQMTPDEVTAFLARYFPQIRPGEDFLVEAIAPMSARVRLVYGDRHLRPGGTISGPAMFSLADLATYAAILGEIGVGGDIDAAERSAGALSVTTNLSINFLRKPEPRDLIGDARLMKLGKRLAVGEVWLHSEGDSEPVAHAVATYSIPPR